MTHTEANDLAIALIDLRDTIDNTGGSSNTGRCGSDTGVFIQRIMKRFPKVEDAMCEIEILREQA